MSPLNVQYAVACLGQLRDGVHTERDISRHAGIPLAVCNDITSRLVDAGILERHHEGHLVMADENPSSLRVLQALWGPAPKPAFRPLYGETKGAARLMLRWLKQGAIATLAMIGLIGAAQAVNPDTMVISVTPSVTYSVSIASPMVQGYQFGTVALGATTISTVAIVVSNNGNVSEFFSLAVSNTSPGTWTPTTGAVGSDTFRLRAHFNTTQPASATFADALTNSPPGVAATLYGQSSTKTNASASRNLWLRLEMPSSMTGAATAQTMTLTINGQGS